MVLIHIDTKRGVPYYRQLEEQITQMILSGQLQKGTQLESVAKLSKRLKVNPMTVSKAYSFMVEKSLLERRPGIGIFVADLPQTHQHKMTLTMLAKTLNKAIVLAVQLGLSPKELHDLMDKELAKMPNSKEEDSR